MCNELLLAGVSLASGLARQQQQANAANSLARRQAALIRQNAIAQYDAVNRKTQSARAETVREKQGNALKALAARETARTMAGARNVALGSRSVSAQLAGLQAAEARHADGLDADYEGFAAEAEADKRAIERGAAGQLQNLRHRAPPNYAEEIAGFGARRFDLIEKAINGA